MHSHYVVDFVPIFLFTLQIHHASAAFILKHGLICAFAIVVLEFQFYNKITWEQFVIFDRIRIQIIEIEG